MKFARIFERGNNQVVVTIDENDDGEQCLRFTTRPDSKTVGNCCMSINFADEIPESELIQALENVTEESAFDVLEDVWKMEKQDADS